MRARILTVSTMSYKPLVEISPDLEVKCSCRQRWTE